MKSSLVIDLPTEKASQDLASRIASCVHAPLVVTFSGEIGTGKTTLIRAMLRALGVSSSIKSPTFSLVESYQGTPMQIHHFDLYRIHDEAELDCIGFRDYFSEQAICCIEWPERASGYLARPDITFSLSLKGLGRQIVVEALSPSGVAILSCLQVNNEYTS